MSDYKKVLNEYCHNGEGGLSRRGFLEMFKDLALNNQSKAWKLLKAWGYDEDLYPVEARTFMLTTHSMNLIQMSIEEATLLKDYEDIANKMIIQQYGEEIEREEGKYSLWMKQDEQSYTF